MARTAHNLAWFSEIDKNDSSLVSSKGVLLAQLFNEGFPVAKGFVITSAAYHDFVRENNLSVKIAHLISSTNLESPKSLEQASKHIRSLILNSPLSESLIKEIIKCYKRLGGLLNETPVNLRPSVTNEHNQTVDNLNSLLDIKGDAILIDKIKAAWSEAFSSSYVLKRHKLGLDNSKIGVAIVVEKSISPEFVGKVLTYDTKSNDKSQMVIGSAVVRKSDLKILEKGKNENPDLSDKNIKKLSELAIKLEKLLYFPQDITFGIEKNKVVLLDIKPLTFFTESDSEFNNIKAPASVSHITAEPAGAGIASGPLKFVLSEKEIGKVMPGDVIVLNNSDENYINAIKKASAVVTLNGGRDSYAATIARKFGIPAISNAGDLIKQFAPGNVVTVNGLKGDIQKGGLKKSSEFTQTDTSLKTATKLYLNLSNPDSAQVVSKLNTDGINPLVADSMIKKIGAHPKKMIREGKKEEFTEILSNNLENVCKAFKERPVVFRFSGLKTNEYKSLFGGIDFESDESNPALGFRGAFRHLHDSESFEMELEAVKKTREKGFTNLWASIPFARTPQELASIIKLINNYGLKRSPDFKIWFTIETPSNVIVLEKFLDAGIDGVSIDLGALAMLTIGADKENFEVSNQFSNLDPSILWSLENIIKTCQKYRVATSLFGLGVSENSELVQKLIALGIDSLSVLPDVVDYTKRLIFQTEKSLLQK